ncbi:hypothetical protein GJ496_003427 [Pomphorhynchus laevis]|nr:hypothetical protein GJ496_003427 [Pomphorhynchus laevis]
MQQQENLRFLAHFNRHLIIKSGSVLEKSNSNINNIDIVDQCVNELYEIRWKYSSICTRCIQIPLGSKDDLLLYSDVCYILKHSRKMKTFVYLWYGSNCRLSDIDNARQLAAIIAKGINIVEVQEHVENKNFWKDISASGANIRICIDPNRDYNYSARLFKCSNDKGYFSVSEKWADFSQDDLDDDDVMLLDTGNTIYIWIGQNASEMEIKLALKAAQTYYRHLQTAHRIRNKQNDSIIKFTAKNRECEEFTRCFHGWIKAKNLDQQKNHYYNTQRQLSTRQQSNANR